LSHALELKWQDVQHPNAFATVLFIYSAI